MKGALLELARRHPLAHWSGRVLGVAASSIEASGPSTRLGDLCTIRSARTGQSLAAEVIALRGDRIVLMPLGHCAGIGLDDEVTHLEGAESIAVSEAMIGRAVDAFGQPLDGGVSLPEGVPMALRPTPLNPLNRAGVHLPLATGVRCIDSFLTIGQGQRVGIFAGSGVGKSTLLGMFARNAQADVNVVALIGERGREVREFLREHLGEEGMRRSVVVAATSDQPAVVRARAALAATAIAEYFRDRGRQVFLMMDSVTRFAMARREIELASGQPPTARGYTPGVFAEIPALCERAGTAAGGGAITAIYTVLVEGDDHNEPIADTLRATLDGHFVLTRELANEGHFPSIDVLRSVSRLAGSLADASQQAMLTQARAALATHERYREMIDMGLYRAGANPELDAATDIVARLRPFLRQAVSERCAARDTWQQLATALERRVA